MVTDSLPVSRRNLAKTFICGNSSWIIITLDVPGEDDPITKLDKMVTKSRNINALRLNVYPYISIRHEFFIYIVKPSRYLGLINLLASGTFVIFISFHSKSSFLPARSATLPIRVNSVSGPE